MLNGKVRKGDVDYDAFASEVGCQAMALVSREWAYAQPGRQVEDVEAKQVRQVKNAEAKLVGRKRCSQADRSKPLKPSRQVAGLR